VRILIDKTGSGPCPIMYVSITAPNVVIEWLTLLFRIWEVLGSILGPGDCYLDKGFRGFPQSLQVNAGIIP
jgi:hypothetical protein